MYDSVHVIVKKKVFEKYLENFCMYIGKNEVLERNIREKHKENLTAVIQLLNECRFSYIREVCVHFWYL